MNTNVRTCKCRPRHGCNPVVAFAIDVLLLAILSGCGGENTPSVGKESAPEASPPETRVIYRSADGRELTTDDLAEITGTFRYEIVSGRDVPEKAAQLQEEARKMGAAGKYKEANELLTQAQTLAPDWPYPTYDMAFSYLLMKDYKKARECYEKTLQLSPRGFFAAITALDALNREAKGELPEGTYTAYVSLEWLSDPKQKAEAVKLLIGRVPKFAPAWKEYSLQCEDPSERLDAIEKGLAANPDAETKGILLMNKAATLAQQGDTDAAVEILGKLVLDPNTTLGNEHLAKQTLKLLVD